VTPTQSPATIADVFAGPLQSGGAGEALVTRSGRYSYAELDALCDRAAAAFWSLGVRPGDRVGVSLPNDTDVVLAFHGLMRIGAVWVGVNRNLAPPEKLYLTNDSGATTVLGDGMLSEWRDALDNAPAIEVPPVDPDALAGIAYTSGTTGHPKGAMHTQRTLLAPGTALVASRGYDERLRKGDCFPLTILNLQVLTTLLVAQAGGCSVIMDRIDAEGVAEWIQRERVTTWNGPPALLHTLIERDDIPAEALSSLDEVWTGGADCPEPLRERFAAKFGMPVLATYGLSEAPSVVTIDGRDGGHRPGASGRPLPHLAVRIVDDDGAPLPSGKAGEICVGPVDDGPWAGSYRTMLGYLGRPDATDSTLAGGLLHTGDIGELDADGYLYVRDRKNLVIIRGGANIYPAEVERVLGEGPGVAGCAVFGLPDDRLGERVVAVVEPSPGAHIDADELREHCLAQLAKYKVPESFTVVDVIPRNAMGKVQRAVLRELVAADSS
jgi:long-chain acyl-CoA synthetase